MAFQFDLGDDVLGAMDDWGPSPMLGDDAQNAPSISNSSGRQDVADEGEQLMANSAHDASNMPPPSPRIVTSNKHSSPDTHSPAESSLSASFAVEREIQPCITAVTDATSHSTPKGALSDSTPEHDASPPMVAPLIAVAHNSPPPPPTAPVNCNVVGPTSASLKIHSATPHDAKQLKKKANSSTSSDSSPIVSQQVRAVFTQAEEALVKAEEVLCAGTDLCSYRPNNAQFTSRMGTIGHSASKQAERLEHLSSDHAVKQLAMLAMIGPLEKEPCQVAAFDQSLSPSLLGSPVIHFMPHLLNKLEKIMHELNSSTSMHDSLVEGY